MAFSTRTKFSVLVVCTGNLCRSVLAENLLRAKTKGLPGVISIASAGTLANPQLQVPQEISDISRDFGVPLIDHQPQLVTAKMISSADLILTATRDHRREVVSLAPQVVSRTFTLKQCARLSTEFTGAIGAGALEKPNVTSYAEIVTELADFRALALPPEYPHADDVLDPYRMTPEKYLQAGVDINNAIEEIVDMLKYLVPHK